MIQPINDYVTNSMPEDQKQPISVIIFCWNK